MSCIARGAGDLGSIEIRISGMSATDASEFSLTLAIVGVNVMAMGTFLGCVVGGYFEDDFAFFLGFVGGIGFQQVPRFI